jgi:hypothetical protein
MCPGDKKTSPCVSTPNSNHPPFLVGFCHFPCCSVENHPQMASNGQNGHQLLEANLIGKNHQAEFGEKNHLVESNYISS